MFDKKGRKHDTKPAESFVIRGLTNYRFVVKQVPGCIQDGSGGVRNYRDQLILEKKSVNTMKEPYWEYVKNLDKYNSAGPNGDHNQWVDIVRELLGLRNE